ncbi:unnamed protein product [Linum tenue]|uniref:Uncharacterized protein n=3 Tax=Linum tenue TaxID=586396 RepID=A0AAV0HUX4_9ROSI|nr:unnamed protein product [Linum tenue]
MYETEPFQENEDVQHTEVLVHELSSSDSGDDVPPTMDSDDSTDGEDTSEEEEDDTMAVFSNASSESEHTSDSNGEMAPGKKTKNTKARAVNNAPPRLTRSRAAVSEATVQDRTSGSNIPDLQETRAEENHSTEDEAASNATEGADKRKSRGKTKGYEVKKRLEEGTKIGGIIIEEGAKAPVGTNDKLWKMEIGVIVRVLAPIGKFFWKDLTEEDKLPLFAKLESEFDVDFTAPHVRDMVDTIMARRFRQFKYRCHQHYKNETDKVKARENPIEEVNIDDWKLLCDHFDSVQFKKRSDINVDNRSQVLYPHTTGAKSLSQRIFELNEKEKTANSEQTNDGVEPSNGEQQNDSAEQQNPTVPPPEVVVYADTHKRRDGSWVHPDAEKNYANMTALSSQSGNNVPGSEIVDKVLKKKPRVSRKEARRSAREIQLERELQAERLERQAERETFERRTKQFEEQIEIQQSKLQTQDTKFEEMEASQHRLEATVRDLAARMAGNNN